MRTAALRYILADSFLANLHRHRFSGNQSVPSKLPQRQPVRQAISLTWLSAAAKMLKGAKANS